MPDEDKQILSVRLSPGEALAVLAGERTIEADPLIFPFRGIPYKKLIKGIVFSPSENILNAFEIPETLSDHWDADPNASDAAALFVGRSVVLRPDLEAGHLRFSSSAEVFALYRFLHGTQGMYRMKTYHRAMDQLHAAEGGLPAVAGQFKGVGEGLAGLYEYYERAASLGECMCFVEQSGSDN